MKKVLLAVVVMIAAGLLISACSKKDGGKLAKEEVAKVFPQAICDKMIECIPQGGPTKEECVQAMSKQVIEGKAGVPFPQVTKVELDACISGIKTWTCEQMQTSPEPPKGCEFLPKKAG